MADEPSMNAPPSIGDLLQQAQQMQQQLVAAQDELAKAEVQGTAGGGLVTATVTGAGELVALTIAPSAVTGDASGEGTGDAAEIAETVADLVVAAVRDAAHNAQELQARAMGPLAEALGGSGGAAGLPGF